MPSLVSKDLSRREFVQWMTACAAVLATPGCLRQPTEEIIPYSQMPEEIIPGKPLFYASTLPFDGYGIGVLVESHMGRPTKIEGNELHPASLGSTDAIVQASVLSLYDPDRAKNVTKKGTLASWTDFFLESQAILAKETKETALLTPRVTSPTQFALIKNFLARYPHARWYQYQPVSHDNIKQGAEAAFGKIVDVTYDFSNADVILSLDGDFLSETTAKLAYAKAFMKRRQPAGDLTAKNRLYVIEPSLSLAGATADHRLTASPSQIGALTLALAQALGISVSVPALAEKQKLWIQAAAKDLRSKPGRSVIIPGDSQPAWVHTLCHHLNSKLGALDRVVVLRPSSEASPTIHAKEIESLCQKMNADAIGSLFILGGNPAYTAPCDLNFSSAISKVPFRAHLSTYADETSVLCDWHIPESHFLESWGDSRAFEGTVSFTQPLIEPLYASKGSLEFLSGLLGKPDERSYEILRSYWRTQTLADFDTKWRRWLHDGVIASSAFSPASLKLKPLAINAPQFSSTGLELHFRPDPSVHDGQFSNNGWLQELPKPFTKLTWSNAALIGEATAKELSLKTGDVVTIKNNSQSLEIPVLISPLQANATITLHLGYGRTRSGRLGNDLGANAYLLMAASSQVSLKKTGRTSPLATVHDHHAMEGRDLAKVFPFTKAPADPLSEPSIVYDPEKFPPEPPEYAWGMAINLTSCIGCNACVVACQAENNIPIVGALEVSRGHEMHWLRIDNYVGADSRVFSQPVPCMHCETAPCEVVCPVNATVHSTEGLNQMVYNRCVGTRYCSNNCPYKVRRFNFYDYRDPLPILKMQKNPDVTVRSRGVMEKCTYCIQRIESARITAENERRPIREGEIRTACQQTCPTQAIVFGNLKDKKSEVSTLKQSPLNYSLLEHLNTKPRTTYLARVLNRNPEIPEPA